MERHTTPTAPDAAPAPAPAPAANSAPAREHFWDSLRAVLMLLGIPYHVALSYMVGRQWIVKSGEGVPGMMELARAISTFRMPAFFLIAGYFAAMLLMRRAPGYWLKGRFKRLGIPFWTTLILLVPFLNWFCEISNLPLDRAIPSWIDNSSKSGGYWIRHLWFIIVLLYFCTALALLVHLRPSLARARLPAGIDGFVARHMLIVLIGLCIVIGAWEALAVEAFYIWGLNTNLIQEILRVDQLIMYLPWFALGVFLQRGNKAVARICRFSPVVLVLAIVAMICAVLYKEAVHPATARAIYACVAVMMTQTLIAAAYRLFDRPIPVIQRFTAASFVIYLFHLPIVCGLVFAGQYVPVPPVLKVIAVNLLTLALSYGAWLVIERNRMLAFLFDGGMRPPLAARASAPA